ncbi:hypothetical protein HDV00_004014 [Rhizophlyctis rosea]|nr:hypothetical protein HDV00_004014 [Rhizophlyctis rosea]
MLRPLSNKTLFNIRLVSKYFKKYAREAYNDRRRSFLRLTVVVEKDQLSDIFGFQILDRDALNRIQIALQPHSRTRLADRFQSATILLQCVDHPFTNSPHVIQQYIPVSQLSIPETRSRRRIVAIKFEVIPPCEAAQAPTSAEIHQIVPTSPSFFREANSDPLLENPKADRTQKSTYSVYGSDFVLVFRDKMQITKFYIPEAVLNGQASQQPKISIYPYAPWKACREIAAEKGLDTLADYLQNLPPSDAPSMRKWLWLGNPGRKEMRTLLRTHANDNALELCNFINRKIKPAIYQIQSFALMNFSPERCRELDLRVTRRATADLLSLPLTPWILRVGNVNVGDLESQQLLHDLVDFQHRQLEPQWFQGTTREGVSVEGEVAKILEEMLQAGEKLM